MNKYLFLILFTLSALFLPRFCEKQTAGFTLLRIHSDLKDHPEWNTSPLSANAQKLLAQKFTYLGSGGQCYAFVSEDGTTVLKFFKHYRRKLHPLFAYLPLPASLEPLRQRQLLKRVRKLHRDFNSYKLAFEELREETALLFVHLNKSEKQLPAVTVVDKLGIAHSVDLNGVEFILQKRAELSFKRFERAKSEGDLEGGKRAIDSLITTLSMRCKKGIFDEDPSLYRNLGFIGDRAVLIDAGRFKRDPQRVQPAVYREDIQRITQPFREWLSLHYPELVPHLDLSLKQLDDHEKAI